MNWFKNFSDKIFYPKEPSGKKFIEVEILAVSFQFREQLKNPEGRNIVINHFVQKYDEERLWRTKLNGETINRQEVEALVAKIK